MKIYKTIFALCYISSLFLVSAQAELILEISDISRMRKNNSESWAFDAGDDILVGDSSNNLSIFESGFTIDLSGSSTEIANATELNLDLAYDAILGTGQTVSVYVFGTDTATVSGSATNYHDNGVGGTLLGSLTPVTAPGTAQFDALSAIQSISLTNDYAAFLLTSGLTSNAGGGVADDIRFYSKGSFPSSEHPASLTVIPEPNTLVLVGISCFSLLYFRKRK